MMSTTTEMAMMRLSMSDLNEVVVQIVPCFCRVAILRRNRLLFFSPPVCDFDDLFLL